MAWKRHAARVSQSLGLSASGSPRSGVPVEAAYREVFDLEESLDAIFERLADFDVLAFRDRRWLRGIRGQAGRSSAQSDGDCAWGSAMTLIDSATGCAGYSLVPAGAGFRTIETKVNLSRPITSDTGRVRAEAHVVSQTRQIISTEARLTSRDGRVLAHGTSTLAVVSGAK